MLMPILPSLFLALNSPSVSGSPLPRERPAVDAVLASAIEGVGLERTRSMGGFAYSQAQAIETEEGFHGYRMEDEASESGSSDDSGDGGGSRVPSPALPMGRPVLPTTVPRQLSFPEDPDPGRRKKAAPAYSEPRPGSSRAAAAAQPAPGPDIRLLRSLFPQLHVMPDSMMLGTDLATLHAIHQSMTAPMPPPGAGPASMNLAEVAAQAAAAAAAHMGLANGSRDEDPGVVMARSLETLRSKPVQIPAGEDDRADRLHSARFLGGAVCSAKKLWRLARESIGLDGVPPLANYDMAAIGLMGCVTARAWKELHNPGSMNNTVKLYSPSNMSSSTGSTRRLSLADGDKSINVGESLKEISDLEELKLAVRAMCRAAQYAQPWNQSYNAIDGFLQSSNWASAELSGRSNRAVLLTDFVNYIMGLNAQSWQQMEDFRSSGEIKVLWGEWFGSRPSSLLSAAASDGRTSQHGGPTNKHGGGRKGGGRKHSSGDGRQHGGGSSSRQGGHTSSHAQPATTAGGGGGQRELFCWKFNNGSCPNAAGSCTLASGTKLNHLCDAYTSSGALCKQAHPRVQHK